MRRRRTNPFGFNDDLFDDIFGQSMGGFDDIFERMRDMIIEMDGNASDGEAQGMQRFGFSVKVGPDGVPAIKQWRTPNPGLSSEPGRERRLEIKRRNPSSCGPGGGCGGDDSCGSLGSDPDYAEAPGPKLPFPYNPEPRRPGPGRMTGRPARSKRPRPIGDGLLHEIEETEDGLLVTVELPGVAKEAMTLSILDHRVLHLKVDSGKKKLDRVIQLPQIVDPQSIKAKANNGVLTVTLKSAGTAGEAKRIEIE